MTEPIEGLDERMDEWMLDHAPCQASVRSRGSAFWLPLCDEISIREILIGFSVLFNKSPKPPQLDLTLLEGIHV